MALITSKATGNWSAGSTWDSDPAIPVNGDTFKIDATHTVTLDKDNITDGVTLGASQIAATGTLICSTTAGAYSLSMSGDLTVSGTLQAGTSAAVSLPSDVTFTIDFNGGAYSIEGGDAGGANLYCAEPTYKWIRLSEAEIATDTVLHVDTDVTGDIWAAGDEIVICDTVTSTTMDNEIRTIAGGGIAAGTITVTAGITNAKKVGAVIGLITRNIRIINGTDYAVNNVIDSHIDAEIRTGLGIASSENISIGGAMYVPYNCIYGCETVDFHGLVSGTSATGYTYAGIRSTTNIELDSTSIVAGYGYVLRDNYNLTSNGTISCSYMLTYQCYTSTFTGSYNHFEVGHYRSVSIIHTGDMTDIDSFGFSICFDMQIANCEIEAEPVFLDCFNYVCSNVLFTTATENDGYNDINYGGKVFYSESFDHDQVENAYRAWTLGGIVTSQTASPPTGYTIWYEHACESASYPCFRQYETTVLPGTAIEVTGQIRIADAEDHSTYPPALQIVDKFADPLVDSTQSYLDSDAVATADGTEAGWQAVSVIWANSGDAPRQVIVRMYAQHASGDVDEVWSIASYKDQIQTLYDDWADGGRLDLIIDSILEDTGTTIPATITTIDNEIEVIDGIVDTILIDTNEIQGKLPDNYIMGSSDTEDHDDEIDAIIANLGQVHTIEDESPGGSGGASGTSGIAEGC